MFQNRRSKGIIGEEIGNNLLSAGIGFLNNEAIEHAFSRAQEMGYFLLSQLHKDFMLPNINALVMYNLGTVSY